MPAFACEQHDSETLPDSASYDDVCWKISLILSMMLDCAMVMQMCMHAAAAAAAAAAAVLIKNACLLFLCAVLLFVRVCVCVYELKLCTSVLIL